MIMSRRISREKSTIKVMIKMYCQKHHATSNELCDDCLHLQNYAFERIKKCKFLPDKPACNECPVHCYNPVMREKIKIVMRFAGPRMIFRHPYLAIMHLLDKRSKRDQRADDII